MIINQDGKEYKVFLKYDTYKEEVEIFNDGTPLLVSKTIYPKFSITYIDDKTRKKVEHSFSNEQFIPGFKRYKYSLTLTEGKNIKLLKVFQTYLSKSDDGGYAGTEKPATFSQKEFYFVVKEGEAPIQIKPNKKSVLKALDSDGTLKNYIKEKRLRLKSEEELVELVQYLDKES